MRESPIVSLSFRGDLWYIMVTTYGRTEIAGPRILRAPPHPDIGWSHTDKASAERDAQRLRDYLATLPEARRKKKSTTKGAFEE